jgi:hypothetical protein
MPPNRSTCWCGRTSVPTSDRSHDNGSHDSGWHEPVGQQRLARQRFVPAGSDGKGSNGSRTATARLGRSAGKGSHGRSGEAAWASGSDRSASYDSHAADRSGEAAQAPTSRPIHRGPPITAKRRRRPQTRSPQASGPIPSKRAPNRPENPLRPRLINRPPQASPAFPQSCPQRRPQPHSRHQPGGQPHNPSSPRQRQRPPTDNDARSRPRNGLSTPGRYPQKIHSSPHQTTRKPIHRQRTLSTSGRNRFVPTLSTLIHRPPQVVIPSGGQGEEPNPTDVDQAWGNRCGQTRSVTELSTACGRVWISC